MPLPRLARLRIGVLVLLLALSTATLAACGGGGEGTANAAEGTATAAEGSGDGQKVSLVAYSTPREVYEELIPAFQGTPDGEGVEFEQSYASSGEQSRAVEAGPPGRRTSRSPSSRT